jgi:hypothetical protein
MTQHRLMGRTETELLWFQRRSFLLAAASWTALGGASAAHAQSRSNIVELRGDVTLNGGRLLPEHTVQSGDTVATGPGSTVIFVLGSSAFHVRQNSMMTLDRGVSLFAVGALRLLTGAVASVWGRGNKRLIVTPTLTAGIRGTGVYTEVFEKQDMRSYFCNCYGEVELRAGAEQVLSRAQYHQSFWGEVAPKNGHHLTQAKAINHTDEELEFLARLAGQQTAWQIAGHKGIKDGRGYMEERPDQMHPMELPTPQQPSW